MIIILDCLMFVLFRSLPASLSAKDSFLVQTVHSCKRSQFYSFCREKGLSSSLFLWLAGRYFGIAIASIGVMALGSCSSNTETANPTAKTSALGAVPEKLQVVTTFVPITEFTKAVAGDRAQITQLLPPNVGPHDYQAKPTDVQKLAKAKVLVENGMGMESFLVDIVKNARNSKLKVIDSSQGIQPIFNPKLGEFDHPKSGQNVTTTPDHDQSQDQNHDRSTINPHIYLDPKRAIEQVKNIRDGLIAVDPVGKVIYIDNAKAFIAKLRNLDTEFTRKLKPYVGKSFVTYHDFAPYFAQSYQLKAVYLVGIPEENASPEDVKRVINAAKQFHLKTLLTEPQAADGPLTALAKDLNVKVSPFDSLETRRDEDGQSDYYLKVMRQNVKNLEAAFTDQSSQVFLPIKTKNRLLAVIP
jgi:zinc/manganese transport system substrate-binding protein